MKDPRQTMTRRTAVAGAATAGAVAAAAGLLSTRNELAAEPATATPTQSHQRDAGYRVSEHVLRYYQTTRI